MALKDCMKKIGKPLRKEHRELLSQYLEEGLTDSEAIAKLLIQINQEILDIADRAQREGAVIAKRPGVLAEIRSLRGKQLDALNKEMSRLTAEAVDLEITVQDIDWVKQIIAKDYLNDGMGQIDLSQIELVRERLNKMFFINPDLFREGRLAGGILMGSTPLSLNRAWDKMIETQKQGKEALAEVSVKAAAVKDRIEQLTGERKPNTYFQEVPAFYSGVEVAVSTMPMNKGNAENIWTWLIKQPGVVVETRDVVQRNEKRKILRDADGKPITKEETTYPELDFLGVKEYLEAMGTVTKEELQAFVKGRGVKVEVVQWGENETSPDASLQWDEVGYNEIPEAIRPPLDVYESSENEFAFYKVLERNSNETYYGVIDASTERAATASWDASSKAIAPDGTIIPVYGAERFGQYSVDTAIADYHKYKNKSPNVFTGTAVHPFYQLKGGKSNYRNLIMKLQDVTAEEGHRSLILKFGDEFKALPQEDQDRINQIYMDRGIVANKFSLTRATTIAMSIGEVKLEDFAGFENHPIYPLVENLVKTQATTPTITENYTGGHFSGLKNVFAHIRVNDRIGPNGEKILFVEEIQSDLHQAGKIKGYRERLNRRNLDIAANRAREDRNKASEAALGLVSYSFVEPIAKALGLKSFDVSSDLRSMMRNDSDWQASWAELIHSSGLDPADYITPEIIAAGENLQAAIIKLKEAEKAASTRADVRAVPYLPFKNRQWLRLATKMIIRDASENGYDTVHWTTGDQQNERYALEKHVKSLGVSTENVSTMRGSLEKTVDLIYNKNVPGLSDIDGASMHVTITMKGDLDTISLMVNEDGVILWGDQHRTENWVREGRTLSEVIGKEASDQVLAVGAPKGDEKITKVMQVADMAFGGSGMRNFYDEDVANEFRRAGRKLDRAAQVKKFGGRLMSGEQAPYRIVPRTETAPNGMRVENYYVVGRDNRDRDNHGALENATAQVNFLNTKDPITVHSMGVTPTMKAEAMKGQTYFQGKRGAITFDEMRRGVIKMTESRDLSTFIHEAGHLYLEVFGSLAEDAGATQQIKDDWGKILKYLDVEDGSQITRDHHEKWAKTFERYTQEGKAPSVEMQPAFNEFRTWMNVIYRKLKTLVNMPINDEIRGVMDRMLASDDAIREAEAVNEYAAVFVSAEQAKMTPEAFAVYNSSHIRAHNEGVEKETAKVMADMRRSAMKWWKDELSKVRDEVRAEAAKMPVFQAIVFLQKGTNPDGTPRNPAPFKLNRASVLEAMSGDKTMLSKLPKPWVYTVTGGVHVDIAAPMFGFKSGKAMLEAMLNAPNMEGYIKAEAKARMNERYPDPAFDGSLSERAVDTVHTARRAEIIAFEMRQLRALAKADSEIVKATKDAAKREKKESIEANKGMLPKRVELAAIKIAAKMAIGLKKIRNVRPAEYLRAERRAGKLSFAASIRGDYQQAYVLKLEQLKNFEMYRAAKAAKAQSESTQRYLARFEKPATQKRLGRSDLLNEILSIIEGIELRRKSLAQVDRDSAMKRLKAAIENGSMVVLPETLAKIMDTSTNWQELTVQEFADMRDMVKQLENMAKKEVQAIVNCEKIILAEASLDVAGSLYNNNKVIDVGTGKPTGGAAFKRGFSQGVHAWLRTSSLARILDDSDFGAITQRIIVPMRRAYAEKLIPWLHKSQEDVALIFQRHYSKSEMGILNKKVILIDAQNETYSKSDIISMALNMGNEGNIKAVFAGVKRDGQVAYTEQGVKQMLAHMNANDWAFVQDVWDYYDTYWDDQVDSKGNVTREGLATVERRRRGIAPKQVEPKPFTVRTADGQTMTMRGGYHPLAYDSRHSDRTKMNDMEDMYKKMLSGTFISTSTRAGATYERTAKHGMVVRLDLNLIDTHLREIVRDLAIGDEVNYIKRVLDNKDVRDAFNRTDNEVALDTLNLWLTDAAVGELPAEGMVEQTTSWIRTGFTKSRLGWNAMVVFLQFTGVAQSIAVVGSANYARGLGLYMRNPNQATKDVLARSKFLNARYVVGSWNKDVQDTKSHLESVFGPAPTRAKTAMNAVAHTYFWPIMKAQQVVDTSTWMAAYQKGRNEGYADAKAVLYADSVVEASQTSGFFSDRSGLERGTLGFRKNRQSQFIRIWTTLVSYMLAKGNIAYEKTSHLKKDKNWKKPSEIAGYLGDMVLLFTVEGILSALLYGRWPEEDEEGESNYLAWGARMTAESIVSGIPFLREIPSAMYGSGNTPIGAFANDLWKLGVQIEQAEADDAMRKAFINAAGTGLHIPSTQLNRFFDAIWSEDEYDEFIWTELATGKRDRDEE